MKIKKLLVLILSLCLLCGVLPFGTISANALTSGYYTYTVTDGRATITDVSTSISGKVTIPSTLGGYPVTSIYGLAFGSCSKLTSITIPDSVTSIGNSAFSSCSGLTSITIPDSVTRIGDHAFIGCSKLTSIIIPDSVTSIGNSAFHSCSGLTSITIPDSVTSMGDHAFRYCSGLTNITIGNSVTSIGDYAFYSCSGLTSITIPDIVTSIGNYAFYYCSSLTSITIPDSVTSIGDYAFSDCDGLTSITIPDSVTSIGDYAFSDCDGLTSITIPDSVTSIGSEAFSFCNKLTDICYLGNESDKKKIVIGFGNTSLTNATWHYITEFEVDLDPTCTERGIEIGKCTVCGKKIERNLNALGHYFSEWEVNLVPTCTEAGVKIRKCNVCGKKEEAVIPAGHTFGEWNVTVNPTCIEKGIETRKCLFCSCFEERDANVLGHSFGEWVLTKNPTCTEKGVETRKCTVCGETEERAVNTLPHNYSVVDFTPATCQSSGERVKICTDCNYKEISVITRCHIYKNGKCVSCDITAEVVESKHNYDRNTNEVWTVTKKDADNLSVAFSSQTETEKNYDFIYIYDKNDNLIGKYSGTELAGKTITVTGDTVKINLTSDSSSQKYGFFATVTPISSNIVIGDTDNNGELDANDILNVRFSILSDKSTPIYDVNGDGVVNVKDLIKIKKLIAEAV